MSLLAILCWILLSSHELGVVATDPGLGVLTLEAIPSSEKGVKGLSAEGRGNWKFLWRNLDSTKNNIK